MPGQEHPAARTRVASPAAADGPDLARPDGGRTVTGRAPDDSTPGPSATLANRPAASGLIALFGALVFVLARWQTWARGNIGKFILVGHHFSTRAQLPHGIPVQPTYGYDGQFFYRLALNPVNFAHTAYGITVDRPYRYMRIGYPVLTWLVSFGQHLLVPVMLVAVNVAAVGAIGYLGGMYAVQGGRHALAGLLLPGYFGLLTGLSRDTAEPLAAACLLAALLAVRARRPVLAAILLSYGALTRETVMVAVVALAIVRVVGMARHRARPGRDDLAWAVPTLAFVAWQAVVKAATGSIPLFADGGRNAGTPLIAVFQALRRNLGHFNTHQFDQYDLWFLQTAILAAFTVTALLCLPSTSAPVHERLAFLLYLVEICVVTPSTWGSLDADLRSFIEVYLMAVIIVLGAPRRSLDAWLLSSLAAFTLPALIVVTQRRLTLSLRFPLRLDVDRAARPGRHLDRGRRHGEREGDHGGGQSVQPQSRAVGGLTRLAATDDVVQVRVAGELADKPVDPSEDDLPAPQVADSLDPQPVGLDRGQQGRGAQVDEMARHVQGEPAVTEDPGLEAGGIGYGDDERPARGQERGRMAQRPGRLAQVLKRMPEDDRRPLPVDLFDLGVADVRSGRVRLEADGFPPVPHEGVDQGPVAGSHVENRAGRHDAVQAIGKCRTCAAEHLVPDAGEPARLRAVPVGVGRAQLLIARPGRRRGHAAAGAPYTAGKTLVGAVELALAPGALDGGGRGGQRVGEGIVADRR